MTFIVGLNAFVSVCRVLTGQRKLRADREQKISYAINSVICRRDGPNTAVHALQPFAYENEHRDFSLSFIDPTIPDSVVPAERCRGSVTFVTHRTLTSNSGQRRSLQT